MRGSLIDPPGTSTVIVAIGTSPVCAATTETPFARSRSTIAGRSTLGTVPGPGGSCLWPSGRTDNGSPVAAGRLRKVGIGTGLA